MTLTELKPASPNVTMSPGTIGLLKDAIGTGRVIFSHGQDDPLDQELAKLEALQTLEPLINLSYGLEPNLQTRQAKRNTSQNAHFRREKHRINLQERIIAKRSFDNLLPVVFTPDLQNAADSVFSSHLLQLAESLNRFNPLPETNYLDRSLSTFDLTPDQLESFDLLVHRCEERSKQSDTGENIYPELYRAYGQYFQYFLWKSGRTQELPSLNLLQLNSSLLNMLPDPLTDFHVRVLPNIHLAQLELVHAKGEIIHGNIWHEAERETTRRRVLAGMSCDINRQRGKDIDDYVAWRKKYVEVADHIGIGLNEGNSPNGDREALLELPDLKVVKNDIYRKLQHVMSTRDAKTIVIGVSGDLDSAALLLLLSEVIRDYQLPYNIKAFTLRKDFHQSRFQRIEELIKYLNRDREAVNPIIEFEQPDMYYAYYQLLHALYTRNKGGYDKPTVDFAKQAISLTAQAASMAIDTLTRFGTISQVARRRQNFGLDEESPLIKVIAEIILSASDPLTLADRLTAEIIRLDDSQDGKVQLIPPEQLLHLVARLMGDYGDLFSKIEYTIGPREQSNLIHELLILVRGHLCREVRWPIAVSGQNATEIAFDNFTTSDTFVAWWPMANYPKQLVSKIFREAIAESGGKISSKRWEELSLQHLVPWYPYGITHLTEDGQRKLRRSAYYMPEFSEIPIDTELSAIPKNVWDEIQQVEDKNYVRMAGDVQWYLDPYMHYFIRYGLSHRNVNYLCEKFPKRKTDILLTAFLMSSAREMRQKGRYMQNVLTE